VFLGYYYKDETHQDDIVKVEPMLKMFDHLGTDPNSKVKVAFPEAGNHVIGNELLSKSYKDVIAETIKFGEDVLHLKPANK
jgi:hypothetical protein